MFFLHVVLLDEFNEKEHNTMNIWLRIPNIH